MAVANRSVIINVTPEQFYSVVADFEAYPEFCNDVEAIEVLSRDGDSARVLFRIRVVKSIQYTLNLVGRPHSGAEVDAAFEQVVQAQQRWLGHQGSRRRSY